MPSELRVMSYNIRNTNAPDGPNHWVHRKQLWVDSVRRFDPDLLGTQEVWVDQHDHLVEMFPDYGFAGVARDDGHRAGEWALILYRKSRLDLLDSGTFWLSQTPEVVGSRSWDSKHVRICTWVRVRDRVTDRTLLHANTHLDDMGVRARTEGAKVIARRLPNLAQGAAVVLTGDFNSTELDEPYAGLVRPGEPAALRLRDSYRVIHPQRNDNEGTIHGFSGMTEGHRIDWILHTEDLISTAAEIVRDRAEDGRFPSDHYPVTSTFSWR
jgi:endonuclease/exonuclease/phosphatase family metal-dependent hydrolase